MAFNKINDEISVAPQILVEDVAAIKAAGFNSIICNRPDGEEPGMPSFAVIAAEAEKHGMPAVFMPVISGQFGEQDFTDFQQAYARLPKPILAYCRSGTRCAFMWAGAHKGVLPAQDIAQAATNAGYDVSMILAR